jgi:F420-dependent oxidoreductase-like protein
MRFGIQTGPQFVTWPELVDVWQLVDGLGFDTAWTFDHFFPIFRDPKGSQFEGWTALTALAVKTEHVRVGTLVTGITYRNPAVLAKIGASLDVITGGRLEMGLGAAWFQLEHDAFGIPFPPTAERIKRLGEACEVITRMWTEEAATFQGQYYQIKDAYCNPKPVQKPRPPILIGGGGEQLTLKMVAKYADIWNAFGPPDVFRHKIEVLARHCQAIGRNPDTIEKSVSAPPALTKDPSRVDSLIAEVAARRGMDIEDARKSMLWGSPDQVIEKIQRSATWESHTSSCRCGPRTTIACWSCSPKKLSPPCASPYRSDSHLPLRKHLRPPRGGGPGRGVLSHQARGGRRGGRPAS